MPFHLPGIEKINPFQALFSKGIDSDVMLIGQLSNEIIRQRTLNPHSIIEIENHLNELEKVQSLFPEPVRNIGDDGFSTQNNIERIPIPDAEFTFRDNNQHQHVEDRFNRDNEFEQDESEFSERREEEQEEEERNERTETKSKRLDQAEELIIID